MFKLVSKFKPTGDQPKAIKELSRGIKKGVKYQTLLGVTGSGKTFTLANVIEKCQKSTLIISHNKTLAAQLYQEFKDFFPNNAVHYFVSYYDYYQPEAYIPQTDTYIEKDAKINQTIDRLRHLSVQDLKQRKDVIIIASVSCIYGLGNPDSYANIAFLIKQGQKIKRKDFLKRLIALQYKRNDINFTTGEFRVRGDTVEINLITGENILKIEFFGDVIEKVIKEINLKEYSLYPAQFWCQEEKTLNRAIKNIRVELQERLKKLKKDKKILEYQRLKQKTNYDIEMMQSTGTCAGIENYSRYLEFREPNTPPYVLLDYFSKNFLCIIDESHITNSQLKAMHNTDKARKKVLIEHGFRLPSALDNRPLSFEEFEKKEKQVIYSSATPSLYEKEKGNIVEQLIRPTGLLEPSIEIRKSNNQLKNLIKEIKKRIKKNQRVLCITLTKKMAEELSSRLKESGINSQYLHSEIKTLERPKILNDLRRGKFDVIVGINLLREGLDLPEVSLVAILDADKEGFLRNDTTLIQTMGRAARNKNGHVILYADVITQSMKRAIKEVERRRLIQEKYNIQNNVKPKAIKKEIKEWDIKEKQELLSEFGVIQDKELLEKEMGIAAQNLDFERAARLRDLIKNMKNVKN